MAIGVGNLSLALSEVYLALVQVPGDGDLSYQGVILDLAGDTQGAERAFDEAQRRQLSIHSVPRCPRRGYLPPAASESAATPTDGRTRPGLRYRNYLRAIATQVWAT